MKNPETVNENWSWAGGWRFATIGRPKGFVDSKTHRCDPRGASRDQTAINRNPGRSCNFWFKSVGPSSKWDNLIWTFKIKAPPNEFFFCVEISTSVHMCRPFFLLDKFTKIYQNDAPAGLAFLRAFILGVKTISCNNIISTIWWKGLRPSSPSMRPFEKFGCVRQFCFLGTMKF